MQQIVNFIIRYKYFLFFLLLETIAISLTLKSHSFHNSKFVNSANFITGSIYNRINSVKEYTQLKTFNKQLLEENKLLKNILTQQQIDTLDHSISVVDSVKYFQKYAYTTAKVINNQYNKKYNYLTLNKGSKQGIKPDQGVMNSLGILGITNTVSENYSTVLSILNENSKINAKLKKSLHFGTLEWDGNDYNILQLIDLPIQADLKIGDTLITGGKSTIFPEGIAIGQILNFEKENNAYQNINVQLFNDMSAIGPVYIITNFDKKEIETLELTTNE